MSEPEDDDKDQLWSEASLWFARMRSPDAEEFRPEFEEWLARGALHRRYYNRATEYWINSEAAYSKGRQQIRGSVERAPEPSPKRRLKWRAMPALVLAAVLAAGSITVWVTHPGTEGGSAVPLRTRAEAPSGISQFVTTAGEHRRVWLPDGSAVMLAGGTMLNVKFDATMRGLELNRGNARFEVAHEFRPFVVFAGGGSVTAHGTVFDVGVTADHRVSVRLIKGSVDVRFPGARRGKGEPSIRRLEPGDTVTFETSPGQSSGRAQSASDSAAIQSARDYRDVRVADIVREANRLSKVPIRFADPALEQEKISGRFRIDDATTLAERLATLFDLAVDRSNPAEILLRPK